MDTNPRHMAYIVIAMSVIFISVCIIPFLKCYRVKCYRLFKNENTTHIQKYAPSVNDFHDINTQVEDRTKCARSYTTSSLPNDFRIFEEV
jgi:hypothetical protein